VCVVGHFHSAKLRSLDRCLHSRPEELVLTYRGGHQVQELRFQRRSGPCSGRREALLHGQLQRQFLKRDGARPSTMHAIILPSFPLVAVIENLAMVSETNCDVSLQGRGLRTDWDDSSPQPSCTARRRRALRSSHRSCAMALT
jgi:hypothetical protein